MCLGLKGEFKWMLLLLLGFRSVSFHNSFRHPLLPHCCGPISDRHDVGIERRVRTGSGVLVSKGESQVEILATVARGRGGDGSCCSPLVSQQAVQDPKDGLPVGHGSLSPGPQQSARAYSKLPEPPEHGNPLLHGLEPVLCDIDVPPDAITQANLQGLDLVSHTV